MSTESTDTLLTSEGQDNTAASGEQASTETAAAVDQAAVDNKATEGAHDTKPAEGDKPAEGEAKDDKPTGAPDAYEAFKMAEGYEIDAELLGEITPLFKELNLPQDAAQKLIDFTPKLIEKATLQATAAFLEQTGLDGFEKWSADSKADKEVGGDKFDANLATAKKAIATFGTPELKTLLQKTGLGNHKEVLRAFYRAGKLISEDAFVSGNGTVSKSSDAARMYPESKMNP